MADKKDYYCEQSLWNCFSLDLIIVGLEADFE